MKLVIKFLIMSREDLMFPCRSNFQNVVNKQVCNFNTMIKNYTICTLNLILVREEYTWRMCDVLLQFVVVL